MTTAHLTAVLDTEEVARRVYDMIQADPEAFGLDGSYEPRLGCASTGQLLTELEARMQQPGWDDPESGLTADPTLGAACNYVREVRTMLTGAHLAYRTIDS